MRFLFVFLLWLTAIAPVHAAMSGPVIQTVAACGFHPPLKFDVSVPVSARPPYPAVIVVHGGGWLGGSRTDYQALLLQLSRSGYAGMSVDYRTSSQAQFPAQIEDVKCAIRWLRKHADSYQIDPERIGAFGISAGAHLVALAAMTPGKWDGYGGETGVSSKLACAILHAPPLDLADWWQTADLRVQGMMAPRYMLTQLFGKAYPQAVDAYQEASPGSYAEKQKNLPPMLIIQGEQDVTVPSRQARQFVAQLRKNGQSAELMSIADADHFGFGSQTRQVNAKMQSFLASCFR
jgi:acetyl esterase/lipase